MKPALHYFSFLTLFAILVFNMSPSTQAMDAAMPKFYAVNFYADWCGSCKRLDPEFTKAVEQGGWNAHEIQVVKLDLTDKVRIGKAVQQSKDLGLHHILKANGSKTGSIALIDGESKQEVKRFYAGDTAADIQAQIAQKLAQ
jgi:thiol-disulfide isomerase/thioredoxin